MSNNHSEHRRQFMYLPLDIFRRCTNVKALVAREYQQRKGNHSHPTNFALKKSIENYHQKLLQSNFDWEKSILNNLEFISPNDGEKTNAAIWSLPKETRADVYEKATKLQRKFIYLPLYIFQKETNISQLVQKLLKERKYNEAMIRTIMKRQVFQAHKNLAEVKSWPPYLSDLKFLGEDSSDDEIILLPDESTGQGQPIASTSGSQGQSLLISGSSRKRKESSCQSNESGSVQDKKPKINVDCGNSKIPIRRTPPDEVQQVTNVDNSLMCSDVDVEPLTSTVTPSQQVSNLSQTIQKCQRVPCEPSDFQREIIALSRDDFVEKTNVKELVSLDFEKQFNGQREMTPAAMEWGLNEYDRLRRHYDKWHLNSLKNLKFNECECKRQKAFEDIATQTDDSEVKDVGIQYTPLDSNGDETTVDLEQRKSKLALLTVNEISELQIISIQCDMPDSQYQDQNETEYFTDDMCTVNEAEVDNQQSRVASDAETQTEGTIDYGPGISEVAAPQLSQPVELQTLEPLNYDQYDANNTDKVCNVNETDENDQPSQGAPDADTANSSPDAPEVALPQQSQSGANNDTITDKTGNLSQNVLNVSARTDGNVKGVQMRVKNRAVHFKHKKTPRNHAFSMILREIAQHIESHKAPTLDLKRKVDLCIAMEPRDSNKN